MTYSRYGRHVRYIAGFAVAPWLPKPSPPSDVLKALDEYHVSRLEQVFRQHGAEAKETTCPAIDGIIKAGNSMAGDIADKHVLDAAIASAAQMVEHYEIAQYGTTIAWARELGRNDCADVLAKTLAEEKSADEKLTRLAESRGQSGRQATSRLTGREQSGVLRFGPTTLPAARPVPGG